MKKIRMVDLHGQYQQIAKPLSHKMQAVLESTAFINGPVVQEFQKKISRNIWMSNTSFPVLMVQTHYKLL